MQQADLDGREVLMRQRQLGSTGPVVSELGLGCMGMSDGYGPADRDVGIETIHAALDAGITLLDTGDFYGMGHNELLIRDAVRERERMALSVKFGALRGPDGDWLGFDARPEAIRNFLAYSLRRLGTDHIDIYRPARLDPAVPIEETVGALGDLVREGYVRHIGLSEVGPETLRRAAAVHPICDLQIEYSLFSRDIEPEILPLCRELGIGITAYGVLSRGLLSGRFTEDRKPDASDFRSSGPRFLGENRGHNLSLVDNLRAVAEQYGVTVAQLAIRWAMARGSDIVPVVGARTTERLTEALGALEDTLSDTDVEAVERAVPVDSVAGARYPQRQMKALDSER